MENDTLQNKLNNALFTKDNEKSFIDKLLAKEDLARIKELMQTDPLERKQLLELLFLISGTSAKLQNYSQWERYVILKFFVWVREFSKIAEILYDYTEFIEKEHAQGKIKLTKESQRMIQNNKRQIEHNIKFLVDLYLNISHTSLSLGGSAFMELLKNKFEMNYSQIDSSNKIKKQMGVN